MSHDPMSRNRALPDDPDIVRTRVLKNGDAPLARPRETGPLDAGLGAPWVVELIIHETPITVRMEVKNRIVIGRSDVSDNLYPDLDLTPYGGLHKGVSRQHAALVAETERLLIIDLESTNGTFVNGERLPANKPFRLRHGDEIHIGRIQIDVRLVLMPLHDNVFREQPWVRLQSHSAGDTGKGNGQHVLVVEDNLEVAETLKNFLTDVGYEVQTVPNVTEAYSAVGRHVPDVVVMSLETDEANALALCRHVQHMDNVAPVPVIIMSENVDRAYVSEVMRTGADVFLGKPVGINELVRAVASVTQSSHLAGNGH